MLAGVTSDPIKLSDLTHQRLLITHKKSNVYNLGWAAVLGSLLQKSFRNPGSFHVMASYLLDVADIRVVQPEDGEGELGEKGVGRIGKIHTILPENKSNAR